MVFMECEQENIRFPELAVTPLQCVIFLNYCGRSMPMANFFKTRVVSIVFFLSGLEICKDTFTLG